MPMVCTRLNACSKTNHVSSKWTPKHVANDAQNDGRDHLVLKLIVTTQNGTMVSRIAECHFCGMPQFCATKPRARAINIAATRATFSLRVAHVSVFFIADTKHPTRAYHRSKLGTRWWVLFGLLRTEMLYSHEIIVCGLGNLLPRCTNA